MLDRTARENRVGDTTTQETRMQRNSAQLGERRTSYHQHTNICFRCIHESLINSYLDHQFLRQGLSYLWTRALRGCWRHAADQMSLAETSDGPLVLQMDTRDEWGRGAERESKNKEIGDVQS